MEQDQKKISYLVESGNCVVVGDRNWKIIKRIRDKNLDYEGNVCVCDFDSKHPSKAKRVWYQNSTQHL